MTTNATTVAKGCRPDDRIKDWLLIIINYRLGKRFIRVIWITLKDEPMSLVTLRGENGTAAQSVKPMPSLIQLFSPQDPVPFPQAIVESDERRRLWTADSIHRANNLAQLAVALGNLSSQLPLAGIEVRVKALAEAYTQLGRRRTDRTPVPCQGLLRQVVTGLSDVFGKPNGIGLCFSGTEIFLPADARRALIMIASELVINSLKYAFPDGRRGTIDVSLSEDGDEGQLVVGDDGTGFTSSGRTGEGSGLVNDLGALFGATVKRSSSEYGYLVWTRFPVPEGVKGAASIVSGRAHLPGQIAVNP